MGIIFCTTPISLAVGLTSTFIEASLWILVLNNISYINNTGITFSFSSDLGNTIRPDQFRISWQCWSTSASFEIRKSSRPSRRIPPSCGAGRETNSKVGPLSSTCCHPRILSTNLAGSWSPITGKKFAPQSRNPFTLTKVQELFEPSWSHVSL